MEQPPHPVALWVRWDVPGDAPFVDHLAAVALRQQSRTADPPVRPALLYALLGAFTLIVVVAAWPVGILVPLLIGLIPLWTKVLGPRQVAKALRRQPVVADPYTVTLDAEGLHSVGPSVADHVRWRVFESATVDEDVLVLRRRGARHLLVIPLATLDPGVDRAWLAAEVGRAIAADAPAAAS
ncbi:MAG TPA: hypothetical protein VFU19_05695 [Iamia sp.]|nr:hypothetical protein [Iamia sp.]